MIWIEAYRRKLGMGRAEFADAITRKLGGSGDARLTVPAALITILEERPGAVTHPKLANMIARACGASPEERDMIVHRNHRGRWHGVARAALDREHPYRKHPAATTKKARESAAEGRYMRQKRAVVALDRTGSVVKRLESLTEAAYWVGLSEEAVASRCKHLTKYEFAKGNLYTFRWADEWDAMTPTARVSEIRKAAELGEMAGDSNRARAVVVLAADGRELARYSSVKEAEKGEKVTRQSIRHRCARKVRQEFAGDNDSIYRFADEWDQMTKLEQMKDIGAAL